MEIDIEQRADRAREFFTNGYNCAQSVVMAYADICGVDPHVAEKMTLALGGGVARQREVCGTVLGAAVVLGSVESDRGGVESKARAYKIVQQFSDDFRAENGSIVCRELLGLPRGADAGPEPTPRTDQYYLRRPCAQYVASSARIVGKVLQQTE